MSPSSPLGAARIEPASRTIQKRTSLVPPPWSENESVTSVSWSSGSGNPKRTYRRGAAEDRHLRVLPVQMYFFPVRAGLHRDAIPPSLANVEVDTGSREAGWPPPPAQLIGLRACRKHARPRRLQNPFQMKRQPRRIDRHSMIIRRSAQTRSVRDRRRARVLWNSRMTAPPGLSRYCHVHDGWRGRRSGDFAGWRRTVATSPVRRGLPVLVGGPGVWISPI